MIGVVLDCHDPDQLAGFWADALGYRHVGTAADHALLVPDGREGPKLVLQRVPELKTGKNRMHLDVMTPDIEACARRLEMIGARLTHSGHRTQLGHKWIVMLDPEDNEFCVCSGGGVRG